MKFKIGDKVFIKGKTIGDSLESHKAKEKFHVDFLYVKNINYDSCFFGIIPYVCATDLKGSGGDFFNESDLELYIEPTMKQEKIKPQTFCITGKSHHLQAMEEDLKEIGYYISSFNTDHREGGICSNFIHPEDLEKFLYITRMVEETDKTFNLPSQYSEALQFCKEQKEIAENYFKKEEEFKVGDWVKFDVEKARGTKNFTPCWNESHILQIIEIPEGTSIYCSVDFPLINGYKTSGKTISNNKNNFIKATDEEIKKELERREKLKFPQITIGGYKGVFEKDVVKFGCNHIPKETFISLYEILKKLPGKNEFISMEMKYNEYAFNVSIDELYKIAEYYRNN
jgi:hypothetical protein